MKQKSQDTARKSVDIAEKAVDRAFSTGKADRAYITRQAQLDAAEAVAMAGIAMESDEAADEAEKLCIIAVNMGNRQKAKEAKENERLARERAKADHRAATKSAKQAYDAIKFSDPTKLGFMRFVQVTFLLHIVVVLIGLLLTSRDSVSYSMTNISSWIMVVLQSVAFYFFVNRYKIGRPFTIITAIVGILLTLLTRYLDGTLNITTAITNNLYNIFILCYFVFSERVKVVLVNDLATDKGSLDDAELVIDRTSWPFWRNMIIYFVVFSVLGHWLEAAYCQLIRLGIAPGEFHPENTMLWRDWFYPYPMHGFAVVLMGLVLYPIFAKFKKTFKHRWLAYLASYGVNVLTVTLIELVGGLMFNAQLQNWDYTNMPFNFLGQVCLTNSLLFGVAASVIAWWVYPMLERLTMRVRPATMNIVCVVVAIAGGILFSLYAISPPEGVDLGENSAQTRESQEIMNTLGLYADATSVDASVDNLYDRLDKVEALTDEERAQLKKDIDALESDSQKLTEDVKKITDKYSSDT